jgi:HK97 gp10 family phage protein
MSNTFSGRRSLSVKLHAIGKRTADEVAKAVRRSALSVENVAVDGIISPPKTGRIYASKHRKGAKHQASAPGEFPAADSGRLHQSITHAMTDNGPDVYRAEVGANAPYSVFLELGTSKMAPRPYMSPAFDQTKAENEDRIRKAIIRGARSGAKR